MDHQLELSEKRLEVLHILDSFEGEILSLSRLAEQRVDGEPSDSDKEATRRLVKRMDDDGLVNYESSYSGSKVSLTTTGLKEFRNTPYPSGNVGADVGGEDLKRFHGFVAEARIMSDTPSDWVGVMQEYEEVAVLDEQDNQATVAKDIWCIRLHKDNLTLQLREGCSISGKTSAEVFRSAHSKVKSVGAWLEGAAGVRIQLKRFKILNAELGFEGHPLAELAGELPGVPLDRFSVVHEDVQQQVLTIDGSPDWTEELEAQSEKTEAISQGIENEMEQIARPQVLEKRHSVENEMLAQGVSGQEVVHGARQGLKVSQQVQETATEIKQVKEEISGMKQVVKDNKRTREALMEQVRAVNQLAQSNKQILEELVEQRKQESDSQGDLVEETIRDVLSDDDFSRPGLQYGHLMAWRDGECVKLLDKSVVEKSDSDLLKLVKQWKP